MTATQRPAKPESEVRRLRRRRQSLLWSSPLLVILLVVAGKLFSVPILTSHGIKQYGNDDLTGAISTFSRLQTVNVAEKWLVSFNLGTALLKDGQFDEALDELETAYALVPAQPEDMSAVTDPQALPACMVNTNMAVDYELKGDAVQAEADGIVAEMTAAQEELDALGANAPTDGSAPDPEPFRLEAIETYRTAEELYRTANKTRIRDECLDNEGAAERNVEKETSAREKRRALEKPDDPPPPEPEEPDEPDEPDEPPPTIDPAEQERQDELEKLQDEADKDKNLTDDQNPPSGEYDPDTPPW